MKAYRVCNPDLSSYGGFKWKSKGTVSCSDYDGEYHCGNGLHAFKSVDKFNFNITHLRNQYDTKNKYLTLEVDQCIDLDDKIKFPKCTVTKCENLIDFLESNIKGDTIKLDDIYGTAINLKRNANVIGLQPNLILESNSNCISGKLGSVMIFGHGKGRQFAVIDGKKYKEDTFYYLPWNGKILKV